MLDNNSVSIVCCADNNYAMPLAVTVRSALENLHPSKKLIIYIVDGGIAPSNKAKIIQSIPSNRSEIRWISNPSERFKGIRTTGKNNKQSYVTISTFYRLLLGDLLPIECDKVIYLDCDLLVLGDLAKLWEIDSTAYHAMGVQHLLYPYASCLPWFEADKDFDPATDTPCFSPGVMVVNLKLWREDEIAKKSIEFITNNVDKLRYNDADVTEAVLKNKWGKIDPRWNQEIFVHEKSFVNWENSIFKNMLTEEEYTRLVVFPYIVHFSRESKPWTTDVSHPFLEVFFEYVDKTAWKGFRNTFLVRVKHILQKKLKERLKAVKS